MERIKLIGILDGVEYWCGAGWHTVKYYPEKKQWWTQFFQVGNMHNEAWILDELRTEALARMPKRVELEAEITHTEEEVYISYQTFNMWNKIKEYYSDGTKVKVIIEEVQE